LLVAVLAAQILREVALLMLVVKAAVEQVYLMALD